MKRIIVDFQKLNTNILDLLIEKFPDGYDDDDIISFRNLKNEVVEAVEVKTEDTIYLVKVGKRLVQAMEDFSEDESEQDGEDKEQDANIDLDNIKDVEDDIEDFDD